MKLIVDTLEFATQKVPQWNPISISGYHIREAGSTALQELAFTLYDGIEYVEWALRAGLQIDDFAPRLSFFFNAHNDFFEEIAKYRAARKVWYKVMTERFKARNPRSSMLRFHTQTAGLFADSTAALQQRRSRGNSGSRGRDGWYAIPAHECARRVAGPPNRTRRRVAVTHPADPRS
jgi:methylmalonyl-CoA mutase cobalamin-binding domain/chain